MARGRAPAGARDQESADADPAVAPSGCGGTSPTRRRRAKALVDECTSTIVGEVESLKGLVDEFSQFARMPSPRTVPTDLAQLIADTLALYDGIFTRRAHRAAVRAGRAAGAARSRADPARHHQPGRQRHRGDGAAAAGSSSKRSSTSRNSLVRVVVADDGPGIPPAEREKLFLPYYSTKRRGSGLGLAIVRRIIAEHGGSIDVGDNTPRGTRFTIELPC